GLIVERAPRRGTGVDRIEDLRQVAAGIAEPPERTVRQGDLRQQTSRVPEQHLPSLDIEDGRETTACVSPGDPVAPSIGGGEPETGGRVECGDGAVEVANLPLAGGQRH